MGIHLEQARWLEMTVLESLGIELYYSHYLEQKNNYKIPPAHRWMERNQNSALETPLDLYLTDGLFLSVDLSLEMAHDRYLIEELVDAKVLLADQLVADTDHCNHYGDFQFYLRKCHVVESML